MAQLVEQRIRNAWVGGSSPPIGSTLIKFLPILVQRIIAVIAQLVEHWLPKPRVAGSSPVYRSLMKNKFLLWAVVALMTTLSAQAQEENNKGDKPRETYLTEATRPRGSHILPAPPSFTGDEFANDLYYYQWGKAQRQDQNLREELIHADTTGIFILFSEAMGIKLSRKNTPEIYKLARTALDDAHEAVAVAQKHFNRTKPFVKFHEESLKPEGYIHDFKDKGDSYPSGHATRGWMMAFVLSNVAPERTEPLMNYARQFALNRVIMGRHWKSDIDAGLMLAAALFADISVCEAYQKQLIKAKAEYESIR